MPIERVDAKNFFSHRNKDGFQALCEDISSTDNGDISQAHTIATTLSKRVDTVMSDPANNIEVSSILESFRKYDHAFMADALGNSTHNKLGANVLGWLAMSPPQDVVTFSRHHTTRFHDFRKRLARDSRHIDDAVMHRVATLVDVNFFPRNSTDIFQRSIYDYGKYTAIDSFESGALHATGYCTDDVVALANLDSSEAQASTERNDLLDTAFHERLHAAGWRNRGFFNGVYTGHLSRIAEEAFVSTVTDLTSPSRTSDKLAGQPPYLLKPATELLPSAAYRMERKLFAAELYGDGSEPFAFDQVAFTFFTDRTSHGGSVQRQRLENKLWQAYGSLESYMQHNDIYESLVGQQKAASYISGVLGTLFHADTTGTTDNSNTAA